MLLFLSTQRRGARGELSTVCLLVIMLMYGIMMVRKIFQKQKRGLMVYEEDTNAV